MQNINALRRQRKEQLIGQLLAETKAARELSQKVLAAAVIGGAVGFIVGIGW
jgi:hypothetical protein